MTLVNRHHSTEPDTVTTAEKEGLDRRRQSKLQYELSEKESQCNLRVTARRCRIGCTGATSLGGVGPHPAFHASG